MSKTSALDDFAQMLAQETEPAKRAALLKRAEMQAMGEVSDEKIDPKLLSAEELAAERQRQHVAAEALIEEFEYSENIGRLAESDPNAQSARKVIAQKLVSDLGMGEDDALLLITRVASQPEPFVIVTAEKFGAVEEPGAGALLGSDDKVLIAEGSDAMFRGDGGAGKTTLTIDMALHLAAGDAWLSVPVPNTRSVLLVENEGPQALFRQKVKRKTKTWKGGPLGKRVHVFERPWRGLDFNNEGGRKELAKAIAEKEIDVVIAGPLTKLGMNDAGTLQQVNAFMDLIEDVRRKSNRAVTFVLIHHDNKAGSVSGAWEWATDALFNVTERGHGRTDLNVQKARWHSELHGQTLKLAWAESEGYELIDERDYMGEIETLLADGYPRTLSELEAPREKGGIGASRKPLRKVLDNTLALGKMHELNDVEAKAHGRDKTASNGVYFCLDDPISNQSKQA